MAHAAKQRTVAPEVMGALARAEMNGPELKITEQLDRKLYVAVNKVLEAAGGKWSRRNRAHIFEGEAATAVEPIILTGQFTLPADFGQFDSPPAVVERVIELANIEPGMRVLEPSAGVGNLVRGIMKAGGIPHVFELDPMRLAKLQELFVENAAWAARLPRELIPNTTTDFLTIPPPPASSGGPSFDRVVMNPPFAGQLDITHVLHAARFLKPGGRLVSVMGGGTRFRTNRRAVEFRAYVDRLGGGIEDLPADSFKVAGTSVSTVIVRFDTEATPSILRAR
jgi:hypothetical protein